MLLMIWATQPILLKLCRITLETVTRESCLASYLVNLSHAVGRLILAGRDFAKFSGYSSRVALLFSVLSQTGTKDSKGSVKRSDQSLISFSNVPVVTPSGDMLVRDLTFTVKSGMNCLVTGPNGKFLSSLKRMR